MQDSFYKITAPEYESMVVKGTANGGHYIHVYDTCLMDVADDWGIVDTETWDWEGLQ